MKMTFRGSFAAGVVAAAVGGLCLTVGAWTVDARAQVLRRNQPTTGQSVNYARPDAELITTRLYEALLDRQPNSAEQSASVADLQRGRLPIRVNQIVQSPEFRKRVAQLQPSQVLDQIYQGFLGRNPDTSGTQGFLPMIEKKQYANVVMALVSSEEFAGKLTNEPSGSTISSVSDSVAASCQEQVVEKVRNDLSGILLLKFDSATGSGGNVEGTATDVIDGNRKLHYSCNGGASFNYEDGRQARSAPTSGDFPSADVRNCQNDVQGKVRNERSGIGVEFESAGLLADHSVRGLGFEKKSNGEGGQNFMYTCQMSGTNVQSSSYRWR